MAKKKQEELTPEMATIKLWKKLKVSSIEFQFSCGGDSMTETEFTIHGPKKPLKSKQAKEIVSYFEDAIYNHVEFYETGDGHYQGEFGTVEITLVEDEGEEPYFQYDKMASSEWSESASNMGQVELTQEEADFIKTYIRSMQGGRDDANAINYSQDFIMSDEHEKLMDDVLQRVHDMASDLEFEGLDFDTKNNNDGWYMFEYRNIDGENVMHVEVTKSFYVTKEELD